MNGLDAYIEYLNEYLAAAFCEGAKAKFHGVAEFVTANGQQVPICVRDGRGEKIIPEMNLPIQMFWEITGPIATVEVEGYGQDFEKDLTAPVRLFCIGKRSLLASECFSTVAGLGTELIDSLPKGVIQGTSNNNFWLEAIGANVNTVDVLGIAYQGWEIENYAADYFAVAISMNLRAMVCDTICKDDFVLCPPVPCPPCPTPSGTVTASFGASDQMSIFFRIGCPVNVQSETLANVSGYSLYVNNVLTPVVFPLALAQDDAIRIDAIRTAAGAASIVWEPDDLENSLVYSSDDHFFCRWDSTTFQNVDQLLPNEFHRTDQCIRFSATGTGNWTKSAVSQSRTIGASALIIEGSEFGQGANAQVFSGWNQEVVITYPVNNYTRIKYCWYSNPSLYRVYEFGVFLFTGSNTQSSSYWFKIEDDGATVKYYHSIDFGATWILDYTSVAAYVPNENYRADMVTLANTPGMKLKPTRMRED